MNIYLAQLASHSLTNKYFKWYVEIITRALSRGMVPEPYYETHHIIPKSFRLGGDKDPANLADLTAKEHIVAHHMMTKFSVGQHRTAALRAYHCMCVKNNGGRNKRNASLLQLSAARAAAKEANSVPRGIKGPPKWSNCQSLDEFKTLLTSHVDGGLSDPLIGELYGISATAVHNWRNKLNIKCRRPDLRSYQHLYQSYVVERLSCGDIAKNLGCTASAVQLMLYKFNIPIRTATERQRNRHLKH